MAYGITAIGAYIPRLRIERAAIAEAHRWMNPSLKAGGRGERAFCSWDEDTVTMAVEALRDAAPAGERGKIAKLTMASTTFPYADLSPGVIVASALGLPHELTVANAAGSQRAGTTALREAFAGAAPALVVASEKPDPKPASVAELASGAGAAAFVFGDEDVAVEMIGSSSSANHFVDHFRPAGQAADYAWEERWVRDEGFNKLVPPVVEAALANAGLQADVLDYLVMPSTLRGVSDGIAQRIGFKGEIAGAFDASVGYCGCAQPLLHLAEVLEKMGAGQTVLVIGFGQGVDAMVLRTTERIGMIAPGRGLSGAVADGLTTSDYLRMLSFYDRIGLDWGMRGEKEGKAALTEHARSADQVDTFTGGKCEVCGTVQFPVLSYCVNPECREPAARMKPHPLADENAEIFTITSDWLSYHPAPPLAVGFVQFPSGARLLMEVVDARPAQITEGTKLRMVFRIKERDRARGYNRYFWKATPTSVKEEADG